MTDNKQEIGRKASIEGFANEKILCGILMKKYGNVSLVDLPLSPYDIIIVRKLDNDSEDIIRIQSKTAKKSISFVGGSRGGIDRAYKSGVKTYVQSTRLSDCVVGVHSENNITELYFVPTVLIEKLRKKSISLKKVTQLKDNYEILDNCKNKPFILKKAKEFKIL
jgi:hypothetical protein